jgi:hypothetical protein
MESSQHDAWEIGKAHVRIHDERHTYVFGLGRLLSGKHKAFAGFFVTITLPDGDIVYGRDPAHLRAALFRLSERLAERDIVLCAVGLSDRFSESEESRNTGMGYVPQREAPVHMMDYRI